MMKYAFDIDGKCDLTEDHITIIKKFMQIVIENGSSYGYSYNTLKIPIVDFVNTIIGINNDLKMKEEVLKMKEEVLKKNEQRINTLEKEIPTLKQKFGYLEESEKLFIRKGIIKQLFVLKYLFNINRPASLNSIWTGLKLNVEYCRLYPSKTKGTILGTLNILINLGYVQKIERGFYEINPKGKSFLEFVNKNV